MNRMPDGVRVDGAYRYFESEEQARANVLPDQGVDFVGAGWYGVDSYDLCDGTHRTVWTHAKELIAGYVVQVDNLEDRIEHLRRLSDEI